MFLVVQIRFGPCIHSVNSLCLSFTFDLDTIYTMFDLKLISPTQVELEYLVHWCFFYLTRLSYRLVRSSCVAIYLEIGDANLMGILAKL